MARAALAGAVLFLFATACYDDPLEVLTPDEARPSHTTAAPSASGIFNGAESFVAGNPMGNFAGGELYNFGYYSTGPDSADGTYDSDRARIRIPEDSLIMNVSNFSFETWIRPSYSPVWQYGLIAMNSSHQYNASGQSDFGYFLLDYYQYSPGLMDINWNVASYTTSGWSGIYAAAPPLHPDFGVELHVVGVHENNVIKLYINGQLAASEDISGQSGLAGPGGAPTTGAGFRQDLSDIYSSSDSIKPLMIGGARYQEGDSTHFLSMTGSIGESAFYRRALTAAEIQEHYQTGIGTPPATPDSSYDPYRDLVLSDSTVGYWRHRESQLHGLATIDGEQVVDASGNGWHGMYRSQAPAVPVSLTCTPTVQRGGQVTCEVLGSDVAVTGWTFATVTDTVRSTWTSAVWAGPAVVGGTVTAHVTVAGAPQDLITSFEVTARPWRWDESDWSFVKGGAPVCFNTAPAVESTSKLGWNRRRTNCESGRLNPQLDHDPNAGYQVDSVTMGPNAGLWYVTDVSFRMDRGSNVNPQITPAGTSFALPNGKQATECRQAMGLQGNEVVGVNFFSFNETCKGKDLTPMFDGIWAHEGFGTTGTNGHESQARIAAARAGLDPHLALEDLYAQSEQEIRGRVLFEYDRTNDGIEVIAEDENVVTGNWSGNIWVWNPNTYQYALSKTITF